MSVLFFMAAICVLSCCGLGGGSRLVDLSHVVKEGGPMWPTQAPFQMNVTYNGTTALGYWYQGESMCTGTHVGTHLDAPCHFSLGGWCVSDIPVERLVDIPAVCIHLKDQVGYNGDYELDTGALHAWENEHGRIPEGSVVLVNTGWARFWNDDAKYRGTSDRSASQHRFPGVSPVATQWLVDQRHVIGVGIDTLSVDYGQTKAYESHVILSRRNVFILENLANLDQVPAVGFRIHALPMALEKASGVQARVVAVVNSESRTGGRMSLVTVVFGLAVAMFFGKKVWRRF